MRKQIYKSAKKGGYLNQVIKKISLQQQELKWFNYPGFFNTTVTSTWTLMDFPLYRIQQGTEGGKRIGTKIFLTYAELQIQLSPVAAATSPVGTTCRMMVYHKKQCDGTATPITDILADYDDFAGGAITPAYNTPKQLKYFPKRATVIWDKMHSMYILSVNGATTASTGPKFDTLIKIPIMKQINFVANNGNLGDIRDHIWGLAICSDDVNCCTLSASVRFRYKDA